VSSVYIVEEHASVRSALAEWLSQSPDLRVAGSNADGGQAVREIERAKPDAVLLEIKRTDGKGLDILHTLASLKDRPRIIVLTSYPSEWEEHSVRRAGADGYALKDIGSRELVNMICGA
jgi:NarL family two-component system response regulator LiaR